MRHYHFGTGKWVFIDWIGIEPGYGTKWGGGESAGYCVPRGVELRVHTPDVVPEFAIPLDRPWEKGMAAYATFLEDGGRCRCWYLHGNGMSYAESTDGVHWTKPELGLFEFNGSRANNFIDCYGEGVFIDPSAAAAQRYKMICCQWTATERAVLGAVSPDGLRWTRLPEPILPRQNADTDNCCTYDAELAAYVLYTRQRDGRMQRRGINRSVSKDFRRFPESEPVLESSPLDPPDWDLYGNGYSKWPGTAAAHLMRLSVYHHTSDTVDVHLATSRDGLLWHRPMGRNAWISGGTSYPNPYDSVYACNGILRTAPGEWSTYVGVAHLGHNEPAERLRPPAGILRARMREDGFMSLTSAGHGEFWTIPFTLNSDRIRLNVKTRYSGFVRAEILASSGGDTGAETTGNTAIATFSMTDCVPASGDYIDAPLTWKRGSDLGTLRGQTVRLHLELYKADLYALRF